MKFVTSSYVETITGKLDSYTGYFLRAKRSNTGKYVIYSCRRKGYIPSEGHWRFILNCAEIANAGFYATDVLVPGNELYLALREAHHFVAADNVKPSMIYHARDIINLKTTFSL